MDRNELIKSIVDTLQEAEELCKGPNYWKDKNPAKYKKMLAKLRNERKTPGSKERAYQQVLQAKRRENGQSGVTAGHDGKGHSKGKMKTKTGTAAKRYQSAEKKSGAKLSIDRKNNSKGYEGSNTRLVPQKLNRGRHKVDQKKLKNWKKKLKKFDIDFELIPLLMKARAAELGKEDLFETIDELFSVE